MYTDRQLVRGKVLYSHGLFVTIMVTTKRPYECILIDSLLGVRYIETDIHIHTACLDVH